MSETLQIQTHIAFRQNMAKLHLALADAIAAQLADAEQSGSGDTVALARLRIEQINAINTAAYHEAQQKVYENRLAEWLAVHEKRTAEVNPLWENLVERARAVCHLNPRIKAIIEALPAMDTENNQEEKNRAFYTLREEMGRMNTPSATGNPSIIQLSR